MRDRCAATEEGGGDWQQQNQRSRGGGGALNGVGRLFKELVVGGVVGECSNIAEQQQGSTSSNQQGAGGRSRSVTPHGTTTRMPPSTNNGLHTGGGGSCTPPPSPATTTTGGSGKTYVAYAPQAPLQLNKGRLFMLALMLIAVCLALSSIITVILVSRVQRSVFDAMEDAGLSSVDSQQERGGIGSLHQLSASVSALHNQQRDLFAQLDQVGDILGISASKHTGLLEGKVVKETLEKQAEATAKKHVGVEGSSMTFKDVVAYVTEQQRRQAAATSPPPPASTTAVAKDVNAEKLKVEELVNDVDSIHQSIDVVKAAVNQLRAAMGLPPLGESREERDRRVQQELAKKADIERALGRGGGGGGNDPYGNQRQQRGFQFEDQNDRGGSPVADDHNNNNQDGVVGVQPVPPQHRPDNYNPYAVHYQKPREVKDPAEGVSDPEERCAKQRDVIRSDFKDAWGAYKRYAWGKDELKPVGKHGVNWGGKGNKKGMALTAIDALSTLYIMGFKTEFDEAVEYITNTVDFFQPAKVSVFEFVIRITGGLLSAYELSGERNPKLIQTAQRVTDTLLWAFNTSSGLPHQTINMKNKRHWSSDWAQGGSFLAEMGTTQMEFKTLSFHTRNPIYDMKSSHVTDVLYSRCKSNNFLCPTTFNTHAALPLDDHITVGSLSDSYYEYLVKQYVLTGQSEPRFRQMSLEMLDAIVGRLLRYSNPARQAFISELLDGQVDERMDHLGCFIGGLFSLAADTFPDHSQVKTYRRVSAELTETCYNMYAYQLTGLPPESVNFPSGGDFQNGEPKYLLRPEVLESIFYLWRATKDQKYRTWAWNIYKHIRAYCRVPETGGFTSVEQITIIPPIYTDSMESFFLAETMKYLYLIFADDEVLDLKKWVFNTEAHPLRIRRRDPVDVWREWERTHPGEAPLYLSPTIDGVTDLTETDAMNAWRRRSQPIFAKNDGKGTDTVPADEIDYNDLGEPM